MKRLLVLAVVLALAFFQSGSWACGAVASAGAREPPFLSHERVLLMWDRETESEDFIRETRFDRASETFGFVVPTPTKPEVFAVADPPFERLKKSYPFTSRERGLGGSGAGAGAAKPLVEVLAKQRIGSFTAFTLAATDADALSKWLAENGLSMSAEARAWVAHYVRVKFFFVAFRYEGSDGGGAQLRSETVRIRFKTPHPYYPYLEPTHPPGAGPGELHTLEGWIVTREEMNIVAPLSEYPPQRFSDPWEIGSRSRVRPAELANVLGADLARLVPSARELVVTPFNDARSSRDRFGDVLLVPVYPVHFSPADIEARAFLLPVLDPVLAGEMPPAPPAVTASAPPPPPPAPSAAPPPPRAAACAEAPAQGGAGAAGVFLVLAAVFAARRRWTLGLLALLGCERSTPSTTTTDAAPEASIHARTERAPLASSSSSAPLPPPLTSASRTRTALAILAGEQPYSERDELIGHKGGFSPPLVDWQPEPQVWIGPSSFTGETAKRWSDVVALRREALTHCYKDGAPGDWSVDVTVTFDVDGGGGIVEAEAAPEVPASLPGCIRKSLATLTSFVHDPKLTTVRFSVVLAYPR